MHGNTSGTVPQNIEGLIQKVGGNNAFEQKLDSMFSLKPLPEGQITHI